MLTNVNCKFQFELKPVLLQQEKKSFRYRKTSSVYVKSLDGKRDPQMLLSPQCHRFPSAGFVLSSLRVKSKSILNHTAKKGDKIIIMPWFNRDYLPNTLSSPSTLPQPRGQLHEDLPSAAGEVSKAWFTDG